MDFRCGMEASTPMFCLKCSHTGVVASHASRSKEPTPELVRPVAKEIDNNAGCQE